MSTPDPHPATSASRWRPPTEVVDVRELRLALVFYGGVSLAIYMHGIAKELERLVRASRDAAPGAHAPDAAARGTRQAYGDALAARGGRDGVRTRVVIDIVSGTSAGGINGVCLAKALATGADQEPLTRVWLRRAAITRLLGPSLRGVLSGKRLHGWALEALQEMRPADGERPLLPHGTTLELFVTATDVNGRLRTLAIAAPPQIETLVNRHVFEFRQRVDPTQPDAGSPFASARDRLLAFAMRATSSFPVAFPPATADELGTWPASLPAEEAAASLFPAYGDHGRQGLRTAFVDGGVLDNFPFRNAIRAVTGKPAATEVDRRLLFLEPDPRPMQLTTGRPPLPAIVWRSLSSLPRRQPVDAALVELAGRNDRARRLRRALAAIDDGNDAPQLGPALTAMYRQIRSDHAVAQLAELLAGDRAPSERSLSLRRAAECWATCERDDFADWSEPFDLDYDVRRLRFVIGVLNRSYPRRDREPAHEPPRVELNELKQALYDLVAEHIERVRPDVQLLEEARRALGPPEDPAFSRTALQPLRDGLVATAGAIDVPGRARRAIVGAGTTPARWRAGLLTAYDEFAAWDGVLLGVRIHSDLGELDEVEVVRLSPADATGTSPRGVRKLKGIRLGHFGAFFSRRWRENDYLWGRLDAAELLLRLLGETRREVYDAATGAILAEEADHLPRRLIAAVEKERRGQIAAS